MNAAILLSHRRTSWIIAPVTYSIHSYWLPISHGDQATEDTTYMPTTYSTIRISYRQTVTSTFHASPPICTISMGFSKTRHYTHSLVFCYSSCWVGSGIYSQVSLEQRRVWHGLLPDSLWGIVISCLQVRSFVPRNRVWFYCRIFGIGFMVAALWYMCQMYGWQATLLLYFQPYLWVNHWIVAITYLHHTHPDVPKYDNEAWTFIKGATATIDREIGWGARFFMHTLPSIMSSITSSRRFLAYRLDLSTWVNLNIDACHFTTAKKQPRSLHHYSASTTMRRDVAHSGLRCGNRSLCVNTSSSMISVWNLNSRPCVTRLDPLLRQLLESRSSCIKENFIGSILVKLLWTLNISSSSEGLVLGSGGGRLGIERLLSKQRI